MAVFALPPVLAVLAAFLSCINFGKLSASSINSRRMVFQAGYYGDTTVCRTTPGLTKSQMEICYQQPDTTTVALQGLSHAVKECQHQFHHNRWNCSALDTRAKNPYTNAIFQKGFRETAFAYAISSAGVAIAVARACSQGSVMNCGCDTHRYKVRGARSLPTTSVAWKWGGCSHNLQYGMKFSKIFLDSRENADDIHSAINLHNNQVGRSMVASNMQVKCKCHGISGSCELKTCWRAVPDFRLVGKALKERFRGAILVDQSNLGNRYPKKFNIVNQKKRKKSMRVKQWTSPKKKLRQQGAPNVAFKHSLLYYQKSPNYCERDPLLDVPGTTGRFCNSTNSTGSDSCSTLCCGRGYNLIRQRRTENCNCKFIWCCNVECQICNIEEWISVCK